LLLLLNDIISWLRANELACPVKKYFHFDCPGCGIQRSMAALLQGEVLTSFKYHPVTIPLLLLFLFGLLQLRFRFRQGNRVIVSGYLFVAGILVTNYIYKIVLHKLT